MTRLLLEMSESQPSRTRRVVIVGGGVSGLAAAQRLVTRASSLQTPLEVLLLEAAPRTGGVVRTLRREGFLLEAGPDSFISEKPEAVALAREVGLEPNLIGTTQTHRRAFIVRHGRLRAVPEGFQLLAPSRLLPFVTSGIVSWRGKARIALEMFVPRARDTGADESLAAFVRRRFGREALERIAQPLVGGIYTADPERLSLRATMPRFIEMERASGSVTRALLKSRRAASRRARHSDDGDDNSRAAVGSRGAGEVASARAMDEVDQTRGTSGARYSLFLTFDDGVQLLTDRLASLLPRASVRLNTSVESISFDEGSQKWRLRVSTNKDSITDVNKDSISDVNKDSISDVNKDSLIEMNQGSATDMNQGSTTDETLMADAICLALPAYASARLLRGTDDALATDLEAISYASTATVNLAFRRADIPHPLDGFGFVVPFIERRATLACTFSSVKFAGRAPAGHALLRAFVGGALQPEMFALDDDRMLAAVRADLRALLGVTQPPLFAHVEKWSRSMAQYTVGHINRVARIRERLSHFPTLQLAGNAYAGAGLPDCIRSGQSAADEILKIVNRES
jgi:oxygen-dependent protoporphyrinogen oxidase